MLKLNAALIIGFLSCSACAHAVPVQPSELQAFLFQEKIGDGIPVTDSLLIIRDGKTVLERYAHGYGPDSKHLAWSVTKSITSLLTGVAVNRGILRLEDSACLGRTQKSAACATQVKDLLSWSSGWKWSEEYERESFLGIPSVTGSSVVQMLNGDGRLDMMSFLLAQPRLAPPGKVFNYSTGDSTALMGVLRAALKDDKTYNDFPWKNLFGPLGMNDTAFEQDFSGTFVGGALMYTSARDLAKIGQLLLQDGMWQGKRIIPEGWIEYLLSTSEAYDDKENLEMVPLRSWWRPRLAIQGEIPTDTFMAIGHWGQYLIIIPSMNVVAVRMGDDRDEDMDDDTFLRLLLGYLGHPPSSKSRKGSFATPFASKGAEDLKFHSGVMSIGTNFAAKLACSCAFLTKQTDYFCMNYAKQSPNAVTIQIDHSKRRVNAEIAGFYPTAFEFVNERLGCRPVVPSRNSF